MSISTRSPIKMVGGNLNSGNVNTGEILMTQGGGQASTMYSGQVVPGLTGAYGAVAGGSDVLLFSGAGRLKDVMPHVGLSGVAIFFYDSSIMTSGGPFAASGHKIIGVVPANTLGGGPAGTLLGAGPAMYQFDIPFQSGLAFNSRSGQPGFTATYVPETNTQP